MIKETVDTVRLAELEAEKIISTAKENAQDKRNQVKLQAEDYRTNALKEAKDKAASKMQNTVKNCDEYNKQIEKNIEVKITELKDLASTRMENAVNAVIDALV